MPTYEYLCKQCGERFEKVQSFSARPLKKHETCGGELQKIFHASGVVFKGPGFYATDSRASRASAASTSAEGAGDSSSNGSSEKSDTATKAETPKKSDKSDTAKKSGPSDKPASKSAAAAD